MTDQDVKDATSAIIEGEWKFVENDTSTPHPTWDLWQDNNVAATIVLIPQIFMRYCPMILTDDDAETVNLTPVLSLREAQIACADYLATDR